MHYTVKIVKIYDRINLMASIRRLCKISLEEVKKIVEESLFIPPPPKIWGRLDGVHEWDFYTLKEVHDYLASCGIPLSSVEITEHKTVREEEEEKRQYIQEKERKETDEWFDALDEDMKNKVRRWHDAHLDEAYSFPQVGQSIEEY